MKKILIAVAVTALVFTSCRKDEGGTVDRTPLNMSATIGTADQTRVAWDDDHSTGTFTGTGNNNIGVFIRRAVSGTYFATNQSVDASADKLYYWDDFNASKVLFSAYYPYNSTYLGDSYKDPFVFTVNQAADATDKWAGDLLQSTAEKNYSDTPNNTLSMVFKHTMSRLEVVLTTDNENTTPMFDLTSAGAPTVKVKAIGTASVDLIEGIAAADGSATAAKADYFPAYSAYATSTTDCKMVFIVAPQSLTKKLVVAVSAKNNTTTKQVGYTFEIPESLELSNGTETKTITALGSGEKVTLKLKLTKTSLVLSGFTISPWENVGSTDNNFPDWEY